MLVEEKNNSKREKVGRMRGGTTEKKENLKERRKKLPYPSAKEEKSRTKSRKTCQRFHPYNL